MSAASVTAPAPTRRVAVPAGARGLAARLAALFAADCEVVVRLNDAQRRLAAANERLWSGLAPDAFGLIYDGAAPAGHSQLARLIKAAGPQTAVLCALQDAHWTITRAFCAYQSACEQRRQLAVEVGELSLQLTEVLCAAGWSTHDAERADVHQLASEPATRQRESQRSAPQPQPRRSRRSSKRTPASCTYRRSAPGSASWPTRRSASSRRRWRTSPHCSKPKCRSAPSAGSGDG